MAVFWSSLAAVRSCRRSATKSARSQASSTFRLPSTGSWSVPWGTCLSAYLSTWVAAVGRVADRVRGGDVGRGRTRVQETGLATRPVGPHHACGVGWTGKTSRPVGGWSRAGPGRTVRSRRGAETPVGDRGCGRGDGQVVPVPVQVHGEFGSGDGVSGVTYARHRPLTSACPSGVCFLVRSETPSLLGRGH